MKLSKFARNGLSAEMTKSVVVDEKNSLQYLAHILVVVQGLKDFTYIAFKGFFVVSLFIWQFTILNEHRLKLSTHHRIIAF